MWHVLDTDSKNYVQSVLKSGTVSTQIMEVPPARLQFCFTHDVTDKWILCNREWPTDEGCCKLQTKVVLPSDVMDESETIWFIPWYKIRSFQKFSPRASGVSWILKILPTDICLLFVWTSERTPACSLCVTSIHSLTSVGCFSRPDRCFSYLQRFSRRLSDARLMMFFSHLFRFFMQCATMLMWHTTLVFFVACMFWWNTWLLIATQKSWLEGEIKSTTIHR